MNADPIRNDKQSEEHQMSEVPTPLMIGGKLVQSKTTEWRDVINPATQEVVAKVPFATREELTWRWPIPSEAFKTWRNAGQARACASC